jgi:hypothetical protein
MRIRRRQIHVLAAAGLALSLTLLATATVPAAGFLEALFGGFQQQQQRSPAATTMSYASTTTVTEDVKEPKRERAQIAVTAMPNTFCVRTCDGRFFPIPRHPGATPVQVCSAFCPAAETKVYSGSEIAQAYGSDGKRYADLENAFVYRQKIVPDCTCNGRDAFGLAPYDVNKDTTLRAGDLVATSDGLKRFGGSQTALQRGTGFTPVPSVAGIGAQHRVATNGLAAN